MEKSSEMVKIVFVRPDGSESVVEAKPGSTLMQTAIDNNISGITAECGGCCQCATCHVYISSPWRERLKPISAMEEPMLDNTLCERRTDSRLSCEIPITVELDGLVVHLPERQV
jgi:ferredoxin, 2Fe-2S